MQYIAIILGIALLLIVLWDSFETIVLPRRVQRRLRLTYLFYAFTWQFWSTTSDVAQGNTTGAFSLPLLPGDYLVRALPQSTFDSSSAARRQIEKYAADGMPMTVAESGVSTVALKVQAANPR